MQRVLQLTCCHALNALSPSLRGAADAAAPANRSLTAAGVEPAIQRLSKAVSSGHGVAVPAHNTTLWEHWADAVTGQPGQADAFLSVPDPKRWRAM